MTDDPLAPASPDDIDEAVARLMADIDWFRTHHIEGPELDRIYDTVKSSSGRLYGWLKDVESERALYWYDLSAAIKAAGERAFMSPGETLVALIQNGAIRVNTKRTLDSLRTLGIDLSEFNLESEET